MIQRFAIIILSLCLILVNAESQPRTLKKLASSSMTSKIPFVGIDGMTIRGSSVYVVDRVMHRVAVMDIKDLKYKLDFSKSDHPDASLFIPGFIAVTGKNIFVADFGQSSIRIYTHSFDYIRKIEVKGSVFDIAADAQDNIWIASATMAAQQTLKKIDLDGNLIQELPLKYASGNQFDILYTFCIDENNYFYIAYFTKNCIEVVHPSQGFVRQFMVPGLPSNVPWSKMKRGMFSKDILLPDGNMFNSIATDHKGRLFILTGDYSETPFREVDICSIDGKFLSWCNLEEKSHLIQIDSQGHLISVEGNKNKVKVYELNSPTSRSKNR